MNRTVPASSAAARYRRWEEEEEEEDAFLPEEDVDVDDDLPFPCLEGCLDLP